MQSKQKTLQTFETNIFSTFFPSRPFLHGSSCCLMAAFAIFSPCCSDLAICTNNKQAATACLLASDGGKKNKQRC